MATPVVVVSSGGIPVTQTDNGTPLTEAANGIGTPVTLVSSGGLPVNIAGGGGFVFVNAEAAAYVARMSPQPNDTRKGLIDALFTALKLGATSGTNILSKLDVLVLLKSHAQQPSLLNAVSANFDAALIADPTFIVDGGWVCDGVNDQINSNYDPIIASGNYIQDSACFGYWENHDLQTVSHRCGWFVGGNGTIINPRGTNNTVVYRVNSTNTITSAVGIAPTSIAFNAINRSDAVTTRFFRNGSSVMSSSGNPSTPMESAFIRMGGIQAVSFVPSTPWCYVIGGSLTAAEHLDLYNALNTYFGAF